MQIEQIVQTAKPRFAAIFQDGLNYDELKAILAELAEVHPLVLDDMMQYLPVTFEEAGKVLDALAKMTNGFYPMERYDITTIPFGLLPTENQSEVARLKAEIEDDYVAAMRGLKGLAEGTSRHRTVTAKMENMGKQVFDLCARIGHDAALQWFISMMDKSEGKQPNA